MAACGSIDRRPSRPLKQENRGRKMSVKIWHQSFTTLARVPAYIENLKAHVKKVTRPDTVVEIHGSHPGTHGHRPGDGPSTDIGFVYLQMLHMHQFAYAAILAEER